jgi:hypothetical protein
MSPFIRSALLAALAAAAAAPSAALAESSTIRIEPRPYQGATVTIEHNVRVYRPLPTIKQVIINPNQTPLYLSYAEVNEQRENHNYNYNYNYDRDAYAVPGYGGGVGFFPNRFTGRPLHRPHKPIMRGLGGGGPR